MKKISFHLTLSFLLFCFVIPSGISQTQKNPFDVKQKKSTTYQSNQPSTLLSTGSVGEQASERNISPSVDFQFKAQPFVKPKAIEKKKFSGLQFNDNGLLIYAESKTEYGFPYQNRSEEELINACYSFLGEINRAMQINDPLLEFTTIDLQSDEIEMDHVKMQQYLKGVEVYGGQIILHGKSQKVDRFNGTYYPTPQIETVDPTITPQQAVSAVAEDVETVAVVKELSIAEKELLNYDEPVAELIIYHHERDFSAERLAYRVSIYPNFLFQWIYFVDATTGEVIHKYNNTCTDGPHTAQEVDLNGVSRTINTYQVGSQYYMLDGSRPMFNAGQSSLPDNPVGAILTLDANFTNLNNVSVNHITSSNNVWNNPTAVSAHHGAAVTYEYYKNTHSRNSIDGAGGTMISVINLADTDGSGLDNAYWNGAAMLYGNGDQIFKPLAGSQDVASHEMTHGVISKTANLEYQYESGAINEAIADIAGCMVDRDNWQLGEDVIKPNSPYFPTGAMRDMQDPHNGGSSLDDPSFQPAHVNEKYTGSDDNGGVHKNSGIINHAYYKLAESISKNKAEKLYYRALVNYMTKSSQFIDCRLAFEQAAKDLYGNGSDEFNAVVNSFYSVGIGEPGGGGDGSGPPGELPENPGDDYIISYDVNPGDANTLYRSNTAGQDYVALTQTKLKRKPSVVDNGSASVYIGENSSMYALELSSPYNESVISPDQIWDNVAVSKDGNRIAAITTEIDSAIWVYDFGLEQWAKFHLYNPTNTEGGATHNVLYADAIEWDYTGQNLIYDAYNKLENNNGEDIDYWDMGIIRVWSPANNTFGDGEIFKLFSSLPEGVSIGNPSLSKNSPYIIAFDYLDEVNNEVYVLAANLETGDIADVYENQVLGFPNYSKKDNKLVFSALDDSNVEEVVREIDLKADKITPNGTSSVLINVAKWPVWYAMGNRNLTDVNENQEASFFTNVYPNPFDDVISVAMDVNENVDYRLELFDIFGKLIKSTEGKSGNGISKVIFETGNLSSGTYLVKMTIGNQFSSKKIIKME